MRNIFFILSIFTILNNSYGQVSTPTIITKNGKFGIVDFYGNIIVDIVCDTIYSYPSNFKEYIEVEPAINPFFIMKQNNKYAYAYYSTDGEYLRFFKDTDLWHWEVSDFIYDSLSTDGFMKPYFDFEAYDANQGCFINPLFWPTFSIKYLKDRKWGIMYSMWGDAKDSKTKEKLYWLPIGFSKLSIIEAKYDSIGNRPKDFANRSNDQIYITKKNKKYGLLFISPPHKTIVVDEIFDSIIPKVYGGVYALYRNVKKDNKWGVIRLNHLDGRWDYIVPCKYNTPPESLSDKIVAYTDSSTVLYDYDGSGKSIELNIIKDKDYKSFRNFFTFKNFYLFLFTSKFEYPDCTNSGTGEITNKQAYNIILIDTTKNQIINKFLSTRDVFYKHYYAKEYIKPYNANKQILSMLISKKVKSEDSFTEYFIDVESGEVKFSVNLSNNGKDDCLWYFEWGYSDQYLPIINYKKRKNGKRKKKYIGYYDFKTKEYKKGRCRGCR